MARAPSAVMTPADKKAVAAGLKTEIKAAKDNIKELAGIRKEADKVFALATKAHLNALKENDKAALAANKIVSVLEGKLLAVVPAKATA